MSYRVIDLLSAQSLANVAQVIGAQALAELDPPNVRMPVRLARLPTWRTFRELDRLMRERASVLPRAR